MSLRIAIQMDPLEEVNINADTTFALAEEAQTRGHKLFVYGPQHLSFDTGRLLARARPATVQRVKETPGVFGDETVLDLASDIDVVLMRQDPPFDMSYITACHLLELLKGQTLVLNDPEFVRSGPEKLFPLLFPEIIPDTLISRDLKAIEAFRQRHRDIMRQLGASQPGGKGAATPRPPTAASVMSGLSMPPSTARSGASTSRAPKKAHAW